MSTNLAEAQEHHRRGFQLQAEGLYQEARDHFLSAIEKSPEWASPHLGLGQTYFFQNEQDLSKAAKSFLRVVELKPDWVEGYHWLGAAQQKAGSSEDAVKSYRAAIRIAPSDPRPLIALGVCLTEMSQYTEAIDCLRRAIALNPPYALASAHLFLADALKAKGELDAACEEWRLVVSLPPGYPDESAKKEAEKRLAENCGDSRKRQRKDNC